jgi:hypothetical protein
MGAAAGRNTVNPWVGIHDRKQKMCCSYRFIYGDKERQEMRKLREIMKTYTPTEDETISCKDKVSGVKCKKIKKSNYFKPFYQTSRF